MNPDRKRKLTCVRMGLYFDDGNTTVTRSPIKPVRIGTRTKLGWWLMLVGAWIIFGNPKEFRTFINPIQEEHDG